MSNRLYPHCFFGETDPYVDAQGNLIPCCWVANEFEKSTMTFLPDTHKDRMGQFNLKYDSFQNLITSSAWKEFTYSLRDPDVAFKKCSRICRYRNDTAERSMTAGYDYNKMYFSKTVHVELTSRCTLACTKCVRTMRKGSYAITDMPLEQVQSLAEQTLFPIVLLCGGLGDPIYHRDFHDVLETLLQGGKFVKVVTCGSNRSQKWWDKTAEIASRYPKMVQFTFSIDGLKDTNHLYRINSNWDSIQIAIDTMSKTGIHLVWKFIVFSHNQHQIDEARQIAEDRGIEFKQIHSGRYSGEDDPLRPDEQYVNTG